MCMKSERKRNSVKIQHIPTRISTCEKDSQIILEVKIAMALWWAHVIQELTTIASHVLCFQNIINAFLPLNIPYSRAEIG